MNKIITSFILGIIIVFVSSNFVFAADTNTNAIRPDGLMIEHSNLPLGIEEKTPCMSWIVNSLNNDDVQTAYQILYATDKSKLTENEADVWNSGKVISSESSNVIYSGEVLAPNSCFYWTVRTWDKADNPSEWAEPQFFSTAVKNEWSAEAIWADAEEDAAFLRKEFTVTKPVKHAIVSSIGKDPAAVKSYTYKLYLNGKFAGSGPTRGIKDGIHNNVYDTFDVTDLITQGANCVGAINYSNGSDKRFQMQLKLFYTDGTSETIATDSSWTGMGGKAAYGDDGSDLGGHKVMAENIDAREFPLGWNKPGYADNWNNAVIKDKVTDLYASPIEPMREVEMPVQKLVDKGNGNYFIQLEKEIIGGLKLQLPDGVEGNKMTVLYGEETQSENTVLW